jgi:hypothetical protein
MFLPVAGPWARPPAVRGGYFLLSIDLLSLYVTAIGGGDEVGAGVEWHRGAVDLQLI